MKKLKSRRGSFVIDAVVILFIVLLAISAGIHVMAIPVAKHQLDTYATELCKTAAAAGRVGTESTDKEQQLNQYMGLNPDITWSVSGNIQLNQEITVTCSVTKDIGLWGGFVSFPINLTSRDTERSEVYWK